MATDKRTRPTVRDKSDKTAAQMKLWNTAMRVFAVLVVFGFAVHMIWTGDMPNGPRLGGLLLFLLFLATGDKT